MNLIRSFLVAVICAAAVFMFPEAASAAPVEKMPQVYEQPDGTKILYYISGDEYYHYNFDRDGAVLVKNANGYLVYAKNQNGIAAASDDVKTPSSKKPEKAMTVSQIDYKKNASKSQMKHPSGTARNSITDRDKASGRSLTKATRQLKGTRSSLVIYICFSDEKPQEKFSNTTINGNNNVLKQVKSYYQYASKDQLTLEPYTPKKNGSVFIYQDSHPRSYYMNVSAANQSEKEFPLVGRALKAAKEYISSDLDLDTDHNGYIDNLTFVLSGSGDDWASLLWPHQWTLYDQSCNVNINGAWAGDYQLAMQNFDGAKYLNYSTICHETGHILGAPDFYYYSSSGDPLGTWDIMAGPTEVPQNSTNIVRYKYFGWMNGNQFKTITKSGTYTITLSKKSNYMTNAVLSYLIPTGKSGQYITLDYRKQSENDAGYCLGTGLMVGRWVDHVEGNGSADYHNSQKPEELLAYDTSWSLGKNQVMGKPLSQKVSDYNEDSIYYTNGKNTGIQVKVLSTPGADTLKFQVTIPTNWNEQPKAAKTTASGKTNSKKSVTKVKASLTKGIKTRLSWKKKKGSSKYIIYRKKKGKKYKKFRVSYGSKCSFTFVERAGTKYQYKVKSCQKKNGRYKYGKLKKARTSRGQRAVEAFYTKVSGYTGYVVDMKWKKSGAKWTGWKRTKKVSKAAGSQISSVKKCKKTTKCKARIRGWRRVKGKKVYTLLKSR